MPVKNVNYVQKQVITMALMQLICTFGYLIVTEKNKKFHFFKFIYKKDLFFFFYRIIIRP